MNYQVGDLLRYGRRVNKEKYLFCVITEVKPQDGEVVVFWIVSGTGISFYQHVNIYNSPYGLYQKVS